MQRQEPQRTTLNDVLITEELSWRAPRSPNWRSQAMAMQSLAQQMARAPETLLPTLVEMARELCQAQTAGISLLTTTVNGEAVFGADVLAGELEQYFGSTTKRFESPCGVCLERGTPVLYAYPERYFTDLQAAKIPIVEALMLPLIADNQALGVIWIMSHFGQRSFDSEDVRVMTSLADFSVAALRLNQRQTQDKQAKPMAGGMYDSSEQQAEIALRESEARSQALIENLPGGAMFVVDRDLRYLLAEGEALSGAGFKPEDLVGRTIFEVLPPKLAAYYEAFYRRALAGEPFEHEHNAHNRSFISRGTPLRSTDGEVYAVLAVSYDISERKQTEAAMATDLQDMQLLHDLSTRLVAEDDIQTLYQEIVATAIALTQADAGSFQVLDEATQQLMLLATQGFERAMTEHFQRVDAGSNTPCGRALAAGKRTFVDFDVPESDDPDSSGRLHTNAGYFSGQSTPLITRSGKPMGIVSTHWRKHHRPSDRELRFLDLLVRQAADLIEQRQAATALRESEARFRSTFFNNMVAMGVWTTTGDITDANDALLHLIGYTRAELEAGSIRLTELTPPEYQDRDEQAVAEVEADGVCTPYEKEFIHKDGHRIPILIGGGRLDDRTEVGILCAFDLSARKRAEEAMRAFFSNVSHEFRTPLTLLISSIQETLSDLAHPLTPGQQSQLQLAYRNAIRLVKLVNTLLDVSRIEADRIQAVYEPTDLATFTTELASSFESAIEQAGLQLVIDCPPQRSPVYVDRSMWEKIVLNLLSNAFKFTFAGEITVRLTSTSDSVKLTVQDTGIGIAVAQLPRLFERFYQVKKARGRSFEGSGIGLSLVQEFVKLHGGTIQVSSIEGEGSCFKVSIPTGLTHLPPEQIGSHQTLTSTATDVTVYVEEALGWVSEEGTGELGVPSGDKGQWGQGTGKKQGAGEKNFLNSQSPIPSTQSPIPSTQSPIPRILLVDDNADMRAYLKRLLSERWQVETAANGAIALAQIQQHPPDLVLSDVMMPELDGLQLLRALRADQQTKSIPIILLSARATEDATLEGLTTGADDYLIKPFSARELMARVETHLQLAQMRFERSANRFKNEFLLTVTHELQVPLATILGWSRLLQNNSVDPKTRTRALKAIERNAKVEAKLVQDLLDIASILGGKFQLQLQKVDLPSLIEDVVTSLRPTARTKQIQLFETLLDRTATVTVFGDPPRLKQVIAHLLSNAIKFTPEQGQVNIRLECFGCNAAIAVTDTGIGISPDFLPHVFERFTQAEVPSRHSPGGVGIGLAISRLLVELHGGTIEAASQGVGGGTTFTVKVPLMTCTELNNYDLPSAKA
ncbi:ATP-binding protein [Scytonema sp. NUACC26]|uniref:ATP-binding protein n=1 Tax=Scytonema sp. NUACC26 TaxID=3140176 RepID=UPI0034DB7D03